MTCCLYVFFTWEIIHNFKSSSVRARVFQLHFHNSITARAIKIRLPNFNVQGKGTFQPEMCHEGTQEE